MSTSAPPPFARTRIDVPLTEEFQTIGYNNYSTYQAATTGANMGRQPGVSPYTYSLATQEHIDVRTFNSPTAVGAVPENWTMTPFDSMTLGPNASFNNWLTMSATMNAGVTTFSSTANALDLTQLGVGATLTMALPSFPIADVTSSSCFLQLSDGVRTASMPFAIGSAVGSAIPLLLSASSADMVSYLIEDFNTIDLTAVTTVNIVIAATNTCTVNVLALRLLGPNWIPANMDFDNWNGFYRQTIPLTADTTYFPVTASEQIPSTWYASPTGATDDPEPIDVNLAVVFNTGSATQQNFFTANMRQIGGTDTSQLFLMNLSQSQLNGPQPGIIQATDLPRTLADFQGLGMKLLDGQSMLDMSYMEERVDASWLRFTVQWGVTPYVQIANTIQPNSNYRWSGSLFPTLTDNTYYLALFTLVDTQARIQIYNLNQRNFSLEVTQATTTAALPVGTPITSIPATVTTTIPAGVIEASFDIHAQLFTTTGATSGATSIPVTSQIPTFAFPVGSPINVPASWPSLFFDTGLITDSYQFVRRPGHIGWQATLSDGDASIRSIRPESLVFAEYQSSILASNTPVKGARLYARFTPNTEMWESFTALTGSGLTPTITMDSNRQLTGSSYRVSVAQAGVGQGLISNTLTPVYDALSGIVDFAHSEIHLSIWFPSAAQNAGASLSMYLISQDGNVVPLAVPVINPDHWVNLVLYPPSDQQSGRYQLGIVYVGNVATTFWVDAVSIFERSVTWSARANQGDDWTDFQDVLNSDASGITFANRGTQLQLRAQAHQQASTIFSPPQIIPVYAELGKMSWPEDVRADPYPTSSSGAIVQSGSTVHPATLSFTSYGSSSAPFATTTSTISPSSGILSTLPITVDATTLPAGPIVLSQVGHGVSGYQIWTTTSAESTGPVSVPVVPQTPSMSFPSGSVLSLFAPSSAIVNYQWSFGDGGSANGAQTAHTFINAGNYNVTLTVIDIYGGRSIVNTVVIIS